MYPINSNWLLIALMIAITTSIISFYGYFIYRTIKNYNHKSILLKQSLEDLKHQQEKVLLRTEIEIQEQTFKFISMEIHDNITQVLSLTKLHLHSLPNQHNSEHQEKLEKSKELISQALEDLNHLSKSLDSDLIESHGLYTAIQFEIDRWRRHAKSEILLNFDGDLEYLDQKSELLIFRIIQEALNNIVKHAEAKLISIEVKCSGSQLIVNITDNGKGFDPETIYEQRKVGTKSGLKNMRQRAESLNGKIQINSSLGLGSSIILTIPYNLTTQN